MRVEPVRSVTKPVRIREEPLFTNRLFGNAIVSIVCTSPVVTTKRSYYGQVAEVTDGSDNAHMRFPEEFKRMQRLEKDPDYNRSFTYAMLALMGLFSAMALKRTIGNFLASLSPSGEALALGQTEVDLSSIPEGKSVITKWRGKPIFIRHRTAREIEEARAVPLSELRDPQRDDQRVLKPEWLIAVGICTHLGCVPNADSGDYNGWYCPCQ